MVFALACGILLASETSGAPAELIFEDGFEQVCTLYFIDADEDLFGDPATGMVSCSGPPPGRVDNSDDCDDDNPLINPNAIEPQPDEHFIDENCDGIDGNAAMAVFVSTASGTDSPECGSINAACNTITYGLDRATALTLSQLYVQQGSYPPVYLDHDVSIFGGFGQTGWTRSASNLTEITGGLDAKSGRYQAVGVSGVGVGLIDLTLNGPDVAGSPADLNSYVIFAETGSDLVIERVSLVQGNGGQGGPGSAGISESQVSAQGGGTGSDGLRAPLSCSTVRAASGDGGVNPSCSAAGGGDGGASGSMDTSCSFFGCSNCNARDGLPGVNAFVFALDSYGSGGEPGRGLEICSSGEPGHPGQSSHGSGGEGGSGGSVVSSIWRSADGMAGGLGADGSGGGGGGGGGGCDTGTDSYGGGGGGGGAGGCRATSGGSGGKGGGASFGIHMVSGNLIARNSTFTRGQGGDGGIGGAGGLGQPGGLGGLGGFGPVSNHGGAGGDGADGGDSGGGGGGAGGPACGMVLIDTQVEMTENLSFIGGTGGSGGNGGGGGTAASDGEAGLAGAVCNTIEN